MALAASCHLPNLPFPKTSTTPLSFRRSLAISSRLPPSAAAAARIEPASLSVANPALNHASVLYFSAGYNVQIVVDEDEPEEVLLRRFRREVSKAGVIPECRRRRFFENKQEEKKRKQREAGRRNRRR